MTTQPTPYRRRDRSIRFTFTYEGEDVSLTARQYLDKVPPASDLTERSQKDEERSGFWIELQDEKGKTLYRKVKHNPIRFYAEIPSDKTKEKGEGSFTNLPIKDPKGTFSIIVPNIAQAHDLVIFSSPLGYDAVPAPAEPIARFDARSGEERK